MSDIVERLRDDYQKTPALCQEAAAEITELRKWNADLVEAADEVVSYYPSTVNPFLDAAVSGLRAALSRFQGGDDG